MTHQAPPKPGALFRTLPIGAGLAPMAGITNLPTRLLAFEYGASHVVSEMLSAKGYLYSPHNRAADLIMENRPGAGITGLQLFGSEPELIGEAARRLSDAGFQFIDINMGCPMAKIVKNGEGSALMRTPSLAAAVIRAAVHGASIPVSVKIRLGWDARSVNAVAIARIAEGEGAQAITVHARTREQMYAGRADWAIIAQVKQAVDIPVFGNGDITSGTDALRMIQETRCDGVMVGRAAQGNPWLFREIACAMRGEDALSPTARERIELALRHLDMEIELAGERAAVRAMRKQVGWYLHGLRGCVRVREQINRMENAQAVRDGLWRYLEELERS